MLKTTRTSEMVRGEQRGREEFRVMEPDPKVLDAASQRQSLENLIIAFGCGWCCGKVHRTWSAKEGSQLGCALLAEDGGEWKLSPETRKKAEACKVPALHAEVSSGKKAKVDVEKVVAMVPEAPEIRRGRIIIPGDMEAIRESGEPDKADAEEKEARSTT